MKTVRILGSLLLILLQAALLKAQTVSPAETNTGGGFTTTPVSNMHLEYAIGNPFQTSVVTLVVGPTTPSREAVAEDLAELPQEMKAEIIQAKAGIKAWPVPSEGPVNLLVEGVEEPVEAQVIDQTGKLVQQLSLQPHETQGIQLPGSGIYFIRTSNKEIPTLRLIAK